MSKLTPTKDGISMCYLLVHDSILPIASLHCLQLSYPCTLGCYTILLYIDSIMEVYMPDICLKTFAAASAPNTVVADVCGMRHELIIICLGSCTVKHVMRQLKGESVSRYRLQEEKGQKPYPACHQRLPVLRGLSLLWSIETTFVLLTHCP